MRLVLLPAFALLSSAAALPLLPEREAQRQHCPEVHRREPVVLFDVTGYTFAGILTHGQLALYNDGFAAVSNQTGDVRMDFVDPAEAAALRTELEEAGAFTLCDQDLAGSDIQLSTLTTFRGRADAGAHTFSFFFPEGEYAAIEHAIDEFVEAYFPGFSFY